MKAFVIVIIVTLISFYSTGQRNNDSLRKEREKDYQKWLSVHDSMLADSLFNSYSDFRSDTNGTLGLRIKYFTSHNIPFEGLSKKKVLEFLGKPNSIETVKYIGDSLKTTIFIYDMGSVHDSISSEQRMNGILSSGKGYSLDIYILNNRATEKFLSYNTSYTGSYW